LCDVGINANIWNAASLLGAGSLERVRLISAGRSERMKFAVEIAAAGETADIAKPMKGFDCGVFELALAYRSDAYRTVYAVRLGQDIWVLHAFKKKSTQGIKTPKREIDVIHERIKRIRELLT
jgi:phage-related protein